MKNRDSRTLLGVPVSVRSLQVLRDQARIAIARRSRFVLACANPHSLVVARADEEFRQALTACDDVLPDGVGITLACRLTGLGKLPRITGSDVFRSIMEEADRMRARVFFFGSSAGVLSLIEARARQEFPNVYLEFLSPPFGSWSDAEGAALLDAIRKSNADVLWVGMTAPRQEKWIYAHAGQLEVPVIGAIGAVFDYYAGTVRRAPLPYRRCGLEWLYRLSREPRRLWRRTLLSAPKFVWLVLRDRLASAIPRMALK